MTVLRLAFLLLAFLLGQLIPLVSAAAEDPSRIEVFVRDGCAHCEAAREFIGGLVREQPELQVSIIDVQRNPDALKRLIEISRSEGITQPGVPTILIGKRLIVGFDTAATTGQQIRAALGYSRHDAETSPAAVCRLEEENVCQASDILSINIPLINRPLSLEELGLPLFTIVIGLLDGLNPCSMWVLILMISMLASLADRRRMLLIAGTFIAIEGVAYYAFMAAWLNLFLWVGLSRISEISIALLAIMAGAIHIKDFLSFGKGISLSIPASAKPGIYARLRSILQSRHLWPALLGTALLAVLVQIVELLCTSGFPALYTRILTLQHVDRINYYAYLLLYDVMYMLDDIIVLVIGVITLSHRRLQEKEGRYLKLAAGIVMLMLGAYLLFPPAAHANF